jgi:hypothetical protein
MSETDKHDDTKVAVKANLFDLFETDLDAEEKGKWFHDIGFDASGISIKVRRFSSKKVQDHRSQLERANRKLSKNGKFSDEVAKMMLARVLAESVVIDWKGVLGADNVEVPFSSEAAVAFFEKLPEFALLVLNISNMMTNWKKELDEDVEGN